MSTTSLSFSAPDVALVAEIDDGAGSSVPIVLTVPDAPKAVQDSILIGYSTYSTMDAAFAAAVAIYPDFSGESFYGPITFTPVNVSPSLLDFTPGYSATINCEYNCSAGSKSYQWYKGGKIMVGATSPSITVSSFLDTQAGVYSCLVTAEDSAKNRYSSTSKVFTVSSFTPDPPLFADDAMGAQDPYGYVNTGRGNGSGPDDLNLSYITLIDTTYAVSDLELYVPTTSTVISYDTTLPAPFTFDSNGNCFNGSDYEIEIRVAATSAVLGTVTVPLTSGNRDEYWY